ncbi:MAG: SH3 domain-containing protein [Lachnospiraceae bacterium]|nr:cell wall hydrolase [uncultured Acetatifactor sp.]MCI8543249.1 SH3 domain-containing protein [Lachnospiraceae bacterium]
MAKYRKLFTTVRRNCSRFLGLLLSLCLLLEAGISAQANGDSQVENTCGGVAAVFNPGSGNSVDVVNATAKELNLDLTAEEEEPEESRLVMANVQNALNVRSDASEESDKVGMLYKDCGGTILERRDGWTKLQSGNIIGWASDEYLLFDEEARALANSVGKMVATVNTETLRVRMEPGTESGIWGLLPKGEVVEVLNQYDDGWVCIDFEGEDGYVSTEFLVLDFVIDAGETMEEIDARIAAEKEASRHKNYGEYTTDADTTLLLAALIYCEAGSESYEGKLAVGAVVMNRVRSGAYPNSIHGVIYASGQFTPAMNGKLNSVYASGNISSSCIQAAQEALAGASNVGDLTHFRRNNGREGLVIGNHVFY